MSNRGQGKSGVQDDSIATWNATIPWTEPPARYRKIAEEATGRFDMLVTTSCEVAKEQEEVQRQHDAKILFKPMSAPERVVSDSVGCMRGLSAKNRFVFYSMCVKH